MLATGALRECGEELGFMAVAAGKGDVSREVFDQQRASQPLLHPLHVGAQPLERFAVEGNRQQVGCMHRGAVQRRAGKCGMVADAHRIDALDQPHKLSQMPVIDTGSRAQRQANPVQADRIAPARL